MASCTSAPKPLPLPETQQQERHPCDPWVDPEGDAGARYEPIAPAAAEAYRARSGCACAPVPAAWREDTDACGPFPCRPGGCYVQQCRIDDDCRAGLCSHHASWPHGYCVTSDPK
jgi:hypothetical protein